MFAPEIQEIINRIAIASNTSLSQIENAILGLIEDNYPERDEVLQDLRMVFPAPRRSTRRRRAIREIKKLWC